MSYQLTRTIRVAAFAAVCSVAVQSTGAQELPDPAQLGPYPVGVTTIQFDDHSRTDPDSAGPRQLLTEIYYPAAEDARDLPVGKFSDFVLGGVIPGSIEALEAAFSGYQEGFSVAELDETYRMIAVRDARVRRGVHPLIIFSHGSGGTRFGYTYFVEHMASHGYIVMTADHTGNARFTLLDGQIVLSGGARRRASTVDRPNDVSFLIDEMTKMHNGADSRFVGRVDLDKIGATGMSFGGSTTMRVLDSDPRVVAGIMLAPGGSGGERMNKTTPIMMMIGTEDATVRQGGNARSRQYFEDSEGPRYLVEILDAGHFSFTSVEQYNANFGNGIGTGRRITADEELTYLPMPETHGIINSYATAFWGRFLKGESGYDAFLSDNKYAGKIIFKR